MWPVGVPAKDLKELKASLETIRATAHELITTIDGHLAQLQQQRQAQQEQPQAHPGTGRRATRPDSVFSKLSPKQQQEMTASVKAILQTLIDADLKSTGEVSQEPGGGAGAGLYHCRGWNAGTGRSPAGGRLPSGKRRISVYPDIGNRIRLHTVRPPTTKELDGGQLDNLTYPLRKPERNPCHP